MEIIDYQNKLERMKGQRDSFKDMLKESRREGKRIKRDLRNTEKAQAIIQKVAQQTQENLIYNIENIVTLALNAVFEDPYEFKIDFVIRRNKTECDMYFFRDGERIDPLNSAGFGAADIASIALRVACWALTNPKKRSCFLLDECFKHLSVDLQEKSMEMIKELSDKLKIQFIIISHMEGITKYSDKVFKISKTGKYSKVEVLYEKERWAN